MNVEVKETKKKVSVVVRSYGFEWLGFWLALAWIIVEKC